MKFKKLFLFAVFIFIFLILTLTSIIINNKKKLRVAHAAGWFPENTKGYSNSIKALLYNQSKVLFFEIDLQISKDGRLICLHDPIINHLSFIEIEKEIGKKIDCFDDSLLLFMKSNKHINIITDFKTDNVQGLKYLKNFGFDINRIYPQIYSLKNLGYKNIIYTLSELQLLKSIKI